MSLITTISKFSYMNNLSLIFESLSNSTRRDLIDLLMKEGSGLNLNQIASKFDITRQGISKHLKALRKAKLLSVYKKGRENRYSLNLTKLKSAQEWIKHYSAVWDEKFEDLDKYMKGLDKT